MKAMFPFVLALFGGVLYFGKIEVAGFEKAAAADLATRLAGDDVRVQVQAKIGPEAIWGDVARVSIDASTACRSIPSRSGPGEASFGISTFG